MNAGPQGIAQVSFSIMVVSTQSLLVTQYKVRLCCNQEKKRKKSSIEASVGVEVGLQKPCLHLPNVHSIFSRRSKNHNIIYICDKAHEYQTTNKSLVHYCVAECMNVCILSLHFYMCITWMTFGCQYALYDYETSISVQLTQLRN